VAHDQILAERWLRSTALLKLDILPHRLLC
jgi:hypothetical protein